MHLTHFKPDNRLKELIQGYWLLESDCTNEEGRTNSFFPLGSIEIVFHLKSALLRLENNFYHPERRVFIEGQQSGILKVKQQDAIKTVGITLYPWATSYFYSVLPSVFTNKNFDALSVDKSIGKLLRKVEACDDSSLLPQIFNNYFFAKLDDKKDTISPADRFLIDKLKQPSHSYLVKDLKNNWNFSAKYFEKKCLDIMGVTAGDLFKKKRMKKALKMSVSKSFTSFTDIAHASGYYDQSHFIRDFKFYFGDSPRKVLQNNDSFLQGFL